MNTTCDFFRWHAAWKKLPYRLRVATHSLLLCGRDADPETRRCERHPR